MQQSKPPALGTMGRGLAMVRGLRGLSGTLAALYPSQHIVKALKRQYGAPNAYNPHDVNDGQYL